MSKQSDQQFKDAVSFFVILIIGGLILSIFSRACSWAFEEDLPVDYKAEISNSQQK